MAVIAGPRAVIRFESIKKTVIITPIRRTIKLERVGMRGAQGFSSYEVWVREPGNEGKTEQDYFDWLANAQIEVVQPYLDAAEDARDESRLARDASQASAAEALSSATAADAARDEAVASNTSAGGYAAEAKAARDVTFIARDDAISAKDVASTQANAAGASANTALTAQTAAATSATNASISAGESLSSKVDAQAARDTATTQAGIATAAALDADASEDAALVSRNQAEGFRDEAEVFRDEAQQFRNEADDIVTGNFIKKDEADLLYRHAGVPIPIADVNGLQTALDGKTSEAASDLRYRQLSVGIPINDVVNLNAALSAKAELAGAVFTGRVTHPTSVGAAAGLSLIPGAAPTSLVNGDLWMNSAASGRLEMRRNGSTAFVWDSVSLSAMSQATAEAGTSDSASTVSALKMRQGTNAAIAALSGAANGLAPLGADSKISTTYLPASVLGAMRFQSVWNAATNTPAIPAAAEANRGWYYIVNVEGSSSVGGLTDWKVGDWVISNGTAWDKIDNTDQVTSVQGRQGVVVITKTDVGLSNVDNTSDANKPISTATQTALNGKQPSGSYAPIVNPTFTSDATVNGKFISSAATATNGMMHYVTNGAADAKWSRNYAYANTLAFDFVNDAFSAASVWLTVGRTGYSPTVINFTGTALNFNGSAVGLASDIATRLPVLINGPGGAGNAVWQQSSLSVDQAVGDGLVNIVAGAVHTRYASAAGTGHVYQGTRGASLIGLQDNTIVLRVGSLASGGGQVAGQVVAWTTVASYSLAGSSISTALSVGGALTVTGNVSASGSLFVGAAGGLFVTGQNHRAYFDGAGGARLSYRSDHTIAVGISFYTSGGTLSGAVYSDGNGSNFGFLNNVNGWRFRTYGGGADIYTDAGVSNKIWSNGNIPNDLWQKSVDGKDRFWFATNSDTIIKSGNDHAWRNNADATTMLLNASGQLYLPSGNVRAVSTGGTGQFTAISGSTMAGFYNDGTQFYILKSATSNTAFDGHRPFFVNLTTGQVQIDSTGAATTIIGGAAQIGGGLYVIGGLDGVTNVAAGYGVRVRSRPDNTNAALQFTNNAASAEWGRLYSAAAGEVACSVAFRVYGEAYVQSWLRVTGASNGLYWEQWGGGWQMQDATWIRSYGDKNIVTGGTIQCGAWTVTSDERLKTQIEPLNFSVDSGKLIDETNIYSFIKDGKLMWGVLAQEVQANSQSNVLVSEGGQKVPGTDENALTVDAMGYVYALLDEMKALRARVAELEAKLA